MAGHYRKFCKNFFEVTSPLTELLKMGVKYWSEACQKSFAPDFIKPFQVGVHASDVGAGAVLMQSDDKDIEHPIMY